MKMFLKNARKTANTCWAKRLMVGKRLDSTINVQFECVLPYYICYICYFSKLKKNLFAPTLPSSHHTKSALHR